MRFSNPYWSDRLKAQMLQRWILVHSMLYYELGESIVTDAMYDANCRQLLELTKNMTEETLRKTKFWETFQGFDASTGFDLFSKLSAEDQNDLTQVALKLKERFVK